MGDNRFRLPTPLGSAAGLRHWRAADRGANPPCRAVSRHVTSNSAGMSKSTCGCNTGNPTNAPAVTKDSPGATAPEALEILPEPKHMIIVHVKKSSFGKEPFLQAFTASRCSASLRQAGKHRTHSPSPHGTATREHNRAMNNPNGFQSFTEQ